MRIIAGTFRRRKLLSNSGLVTRPITDRVKETLFERLHEDCVDRRVADVFAGTGTLGLEALSRGASRAVFIENDRRAYDLLERNVGRLDLADRALCWRTDVLRCSFRPKGVEGFLPYDLIFFDPPYRMLGGLKPGSPLFKSLERLARETVSAENALLVVRGPEKAQFDCPPVWCPEETFEISSMQIHLFRKGSIS